ncbi:type II toxin-antitoxin system RelE/ParE family toxin [Candidatus Gottesmanbacteria bacterium]|nr:type II toxin-antitoxin system RelE/ParE family toxin [Candidatus Gottesmanbacteria bacterium]
MPAKVFIVAKKTDKSFLKFPKKIQEKIINAYKIIQKNPLSGSKLSGELEGYYKYRVGDYRLVYTFDPKASEVVVVKIEHRQGVYR